MQTVESILRDLNRFSWEKLEIARKKYEGQLIGSFGSLEGVETSNFSLCSLVVCFRRLSLEINEVNSAFT